MTQFIIAYHGGQKPESPEAGAKQMANWKIWLEELGDAVVNPGTPLGMSKIVSADGVTDGGSDRLSGFTMVTADSLDAAVEMAKNCPFLTMGTLEVAQVMTM